MAPRRPSVPMSLQVARLCAYGRRRAAPRARTLDVGPRASDRSSTRRASASASVSTIAPQLGAGDAFGRRCAACRSATSSHASASSSASRSLGHTRGDEEREGLHVLLAARGVGRVHAMRAGQRAVLARQPGRRRVLCSATTPACTPGTCRELVGQAREAGVEQAVQALLEQVEDVTRGDGERPRARARRRSHGRRPRDRGLLPRRRRRRGRAGESVVPRSRTSSSASSASIVRRAPRRAPAARRASTPAAVVGRPTRPRRRAAPSARACTRSASASPASMPTRGDSGPRACAGDGERRARLRVVAAATRLAARFGERDPERRRERRAVDEGEPLLRLRLVGLERRGGERVGGRRPGAPSSATSPLAR